MIFYAVLIVGLILLFMYYSARAEYATDGPKKQAPKSSNIDLYGKAIAQIANKNQHYKEFVALVNEPGFDVTRFDTMLHLFKQNRLSKNNLTKILASDYTLDKVGPNAY